MNDSSYSNAWFGVERLPTNKAYGYDIPDQEAKLHPVYAGTGESVFTADASSSIVYLYREIPDSKASAQAGTDSFATIATVNYSDGVFSVDLPSIASDLNNSTVDALSIDYVYAVWLLDDQLYVQALYFSRTLSQYEKLDVTVNDLYVYAPELKDLYRDTVDLTIADIIASVIEEVKIEFLAQGLEWHQIQNPTTLKPYVCYKTAKRLNAALIASPDDENERRAMIHSKNAANAKAYAVKHVIPKGGEAKGGVKRSTGGSKTIILAGI